MAARLAIIAYLDEPYATLTDEQREAARQLALTDAEVARALKQSQFMAQWSESALFGEPPQSDAAFLVALRDKLSGNRVPARREVLGSFRLFGYAASICVVLMAVILGAGNRFTPSPESPSESAALVFAAALESGSPVLFDSLEDVAVDPESLAVYLDVPELADSWDFNALADADGPVSDELLSLDPADMEEVLYKLETTNFF
jgi:hypothetical protein